VIKLNEVTRIIGNQIKKYRVIKKMSQRDLAAVLDVNDSNVSGWEAGRFAPGNDVMIRLCEYFGITLDELFGREKKPVENDELKNEDIELFKSLNEAGQDEAIHRLRQMIAEAVADELDRRS
jgi:transcriptional regulator with XRE-family HTH domain